jgi:hypothetical protein
LEALRKRVVDAKQVVVNCRTKEHEALEAARNAKELKKRRQKGGSAGENLNYHDRLIYQTLIEE